MAKREECAFCTKFRQGTYGPKCSYFGKQPVFDGTSCTHNVGMPPTTEEESSTKNNQNDVKDEIKEKKNLQLL